MQVDGVEWIWWMHSPQFRSQLNSTHVQTICDQLLGALREFRRVAEPGPGAPTGLLVGLPDPALEVPPGAREGRGLGQRRPRHEMESYEIPRPGPRGGGVYRPPMWPDMTYTEVSWYPEEMPPEVPPEIPQQVRPEIHVPRPCYPPPGTMYGPQTQVPYTYEWQSQGSQPERPFTAYQHPYGFPGFSSYQPLHSFTASHSSTQFEGGSSSSPYQPGHQALDDTNASADDFMRAAAEDYIIRYNPGGQRGPDGIRRNPERDARSRPWPPYTPP